MENSEARERELGNEEASLPEEPMWFCPVCSTRLAAYKCKLICEKCGYYISCADYY